jgi:RHS repeat-associated protein
LDDTSRPLITLFQPNLYGLLGNYSSFFPEILGVLYRHFGYEIGESTFDMEAYQIDANGNYRHYYAGFSRYQLNYRMGSNQIKEVKVKLHTAFQNEENFPMAHDAMGNVVQAKHKGIDAIHYDPTSHATTSIVMMDRRTLEFYYDGKGERVLKRVKNSDGSTITEIRYFRDEQGQVLTEKKITFHSSSLAEQTTHYLYGPRGLIGFLRDAQYYDVISDHEGSIRLIVQKDEIMAAYDYMPYGKLMRQYGNQDMQISYRYIGQEWDEETGLYNYHARLYDPDIGRFYQIDPQEQYINPYKYAGNSPVSMVDPKGEFAFLLPLIAVGCALGGAYLGGAAANNAWNPKDWDWAKSSTWMGLGFGALAGGLAPYGAVASVEAFGALGMSTGWAVGSTVGLGAIGAYLGGAAANRKWEFWQWDTGPATWSGMFQGAGMAVSLAGGLRNGWQFYSKLASNAAKGGFIIGTTVGSLGLAYLGGAAANRSFNPATWKFSPQTLQGVLGGFLGGMLAGAGIGQTAGAVQALGSTQARLLAGIGVTIGAGSVAYLLGSGVNNSFTNWNMESPETYDSMLNGMLLGHDIARGGIHKTMALSDKRLLREFHIAVKQALIQRRLEKFDNVRTGATYNKNKLRNTIELGPVNEEFLKLRNEIEARGYIDETKLGSIIVGENNTKRLNAYKRLTTEFQCPISVENKVLSLVRKENGNRYLGASGHKDLGARGHNVGRGLEVSFNENNKVIFPPAIEGILSLTEDEIRTRSGINRPPSNCAELHALDYATVGTAVGKATAGDFYSMSSIWNHDDLNVKRVATSSAQRCDNCMISTQFIKNVYTDIKWWRNYIGQQNFPMRFPHAKKSEKDKQAKNLIKMGVFRTQEMEEESSSGKLYASELTH